MSVRSWRVAPLALRLGLMLGAAVCAWTAYEAGTGDTARAADAPPALTVDTVVEGVTDLLETPLPPVVVLPDTPDSPDRAPTVSGGEPASATPPRAGSSPPARSRPAVTTPPRRARVSGDGPTRLVTPLIRTPATVVAPVTEPLRDEVVAPAATAVRPVTGPVVDALSPVLGPVLRGLEPVLQPLDPVLEVLQPIVTRPAEPAPAADGTLRRPPLAATPTPTAPSTTTPARTERPVTVPVTAPRSAPRAMGWWPEDVGATARPARPEVAPQPTAPATGTSGVGSPGAQQAVGDASTAAWTPPVLGMRLCHPAPPDRLPSRSPRPGSRPA